MTTTESELMDWLDSNTLAWTIEANPHASDYLTVGDYIEGLVVLELLEPEDAARLRGATSLFLIRVYPRTPVSFVLTCAATRLEALGSVVGALREEQEQDDEQGRMEP